MVDEKQDRSSSSRSTEESEPHEHVADLANHMERQDALHVGLGECAKGSDDHGHTRNDQHDGTQFIHAGERVEPDQGIDADFGEKPGEHGSDRGWCCWVGVRQPGEQREHGSFGAEHDEEPCTDTQPSTVGELRDTFCQQSKIDGAGGTVDECESKEEQRRSEQVHNDIGHA